MAKCYIRNGVWAWPIERQIKALDGWWDPASSFRDVLRGDRSKAPGRIRPEWLVERADMLRPSGRRRDEIHVATLLALAVSEADLVGVLAAASERNATIVAHDCGLTVKPGGDPAVVAGAVQAWQDAKLTARTEPGRLEGVRVAAERRRAETLGKLKIGRPLWRDRRPSRLSGEGVAEACGLSVKTLYAELGRRPRIGRSKADDGAE